MNNLTKSDLALIRESLEYSKRTFENYNYDSRDFQLERIAETQRVLLKVKNLISEADDQGI